MKLDTSPLVDTMGLIRSALQVLGGVFVCLVLGVVGLGWYYFSFGNVGRENEASARDVALVFNWAGLAQNQEFSILSSYDSPVNLNGDYLTTYCIQLARFEIDPMHAEDWLHGPEGDTLFNEARALALDSGNARQCFGEHVDKNSPDVSGYFWAVRTHARRVSGFEVILYHRPTNRLLFVGLET